MHVALTASMEGLDPMVPHSRFFRVRRIGNTRQHRFFHRGVIWAVGTPGERSEILAVRAVLRNLEKGCGFALDEKTPIAFPVRAL